MIEWVINKVSSLAIDWNSILPFLTSFNFLIILIAIHLLFSAIDIWRLKRRIKKLEIIVTNINEKKWIEYGNKRFKKI